MKLGSDLTNLILLKNENEEENETGWWSHKPNSSKEWKQTRKWDRVVILQTYFF
jgi:hypothetical protein